MKHLVLAVLNTLTVPMNFWAAIHAREVWIFATALFFFVWGVGFSVFYWNLWSNDRRAN